MEFKNAKSKIESLTRQIKISYMNSLGLLIAVVMLSIVVIFLVGREDIVLVPSGIMSRAKVSSHSVDASYLQATAMMIINDRLNLTPENVAGNNKNLLSFVSSKYRNEFKKQLDNDEKEIIKGKITSAFYVNSMVSNPHHLSVEVNGSLVRWVGSRSIGESDKTYLIQFKQSGFALQLASFQEINKEK